MINLEFTIEQVKLMIKLLKNHKKLRKSHFVDCTGGYKRAKMSDELVIVDGLIEWMQEKLT